MGTLCPPFSPAYFEAALRRTAHTYHICEIDADIMGVVAAKGFDVVKIEEKHAILQRGAVTIGLSVTKQDPEKVPIFFCIFQLK